MNQESRIKGGGSKIHSFTDLVAWQEAHKLVLAIYDVTKSFPHEERFGLVSQIRRAAVSVSSNIAEGFSRMSYPEKIQFYRIAQSSLTEVQNQLLVARDVQYIPRAEFDTIAVQTTIVQKVTNGLIRSSRARAS